MSKELDFLTTRELKKTRKGCCLTTKVTQIHYEKI